LPVRFRREVYGIFRRDNTCGAQKFHLGSFHYDVTLLQSLISNDICIR
jgi:hypothetical protein